MSQSTGTGDRCSVVQLYKAAREDHARKTIWRVDIDPFQEMESQLDRQLKLSFQIIAIFAFVVAILLMLAFAANARDRGQFGPGGPDKSWWNSLRSGDNSVACCDIADGEKVEDVDWDTAMVDGQTKYRVRIDGEWMVVPDTAVVTQPNKFGPAVVWPYYVSGVKQIRCFMPGSGS